MTKRVCSPTPKPRIAVTVGDAGGIGPEIILKAVRSLRVRGACSPLVFCHSAFAKKVKPYADTVIVKGIAPKGHSPSKQSGIIAFNAISAAARACLSGTAHAMVTAPVSKESLALAGCKHTAHTELLAHLVKAAAEPAMLMVCGKINSVMVTRHVPLAQIAKHITEKNIIETVVTAYKFLLKTKALKAPLALCALNPHAGDNGIIGNEENKIIKPAIKKLKKLLDVDVLGPIPADSVWAKAKEGNFPGLIVTMYHDQTMIPLKCISPEKIINVTAGLPFLRTSPGHGTAFDIAGKNIASATALEEAILYAAKYWRAT